MYQSSEQRTYGSCETKPDSADMAYATIVIYSSLLDMADVVTSIDIFVGAVLMVKIQSQMHVLSMATRIMIAVLAVEKIHVVHMLTQSLNILSKLHYERSWRH